jgi:hypothetical protein
MKTFFLILAVVFCTHATAQTKGAQLSVYNFTQDANQYKIECSLTINNADGQSKAILCFIKNNRNNLQLLAINNQKFIQVSNGNFQMAISRINNVASELPLYFVVTEGSEDLLAKNLNLVDNEVSNVEDILNILNKAGITPLTYNVYNGG